MQADSQASSEAYQVLSLHFTLEAAAVFAVSLLACVAILATERFHLRLTLRRNDTKAVQAAHRRHVPRIGGVALVVALWPIALALPSETAPRFGLFALTVAPVFLAGLVEDLGWPVRPRTRLLAAAVSSLLVVILLGLWLPRADVPGFDRLLDWAPFAILFTIFATAGVSNSFNLIDGMNGLAAGIGTLAAIAMAMIALRGDLPGLANINLMIVAALMGFLVFNFPHGRIFLGDAGAYSLGHILGWMAILLINRLPDLTPWALMLVFFWPIADTFFAIYRRRRSGRPAGLPDRLHFHQLVMRAIEIMLVGRGARHVANPMATLLIMPMAAAPAATGVWLWDRPLASFGAVSFYAALFVAAYLFGLKVARRQRRRNRLAAARTPVWTSPVSNQKAGQSRDA